MLDGDERINTEAERHQELTKLEPDDLMSGHEIAVGSTCEGNSCTSAMKMDRGGTNVALRGFSAMLIQSEAIQLNNRVEKSIQLTLRCYVGFNPCLSIGCTLRGLVLWIPMSIDENRQWDPCGFIINFP